MYLLQLITKTPCSLYSHQRYLKCQHLQLLVFRSPYYFPCCFLHCWQQQFPGMKINTFNVTYSGLMISILSLRSTDQRNKNLVFCHDIEKYIAMVISKLQSHFGWYTNYTCARCWRHEATENITSLPEIEFHTWVGRDNVVVDLHVYANNRSQRPGLSLYQWFSQSAMFQLLEQQALNSTVLRQLHEWHQKLLHVATSREALVKETLGIGRDV